jgi:hypothetical protein
MKSNNLEVESLETINVLLEAALKYSRMGWAVFPLHSAHNGNCSCGRRDCEDPVSGPLRKGTILTGERGTLSGRSKREPSVFLRSFSCPLRASEILLLDEFYFL